MKTDKALAGNYSNEKAPPGSLPLVLLLLSIINGYCFLIFY
jgi:hypothetical protein